VVRLRDNLDELLSWLFIFVHNCSWQLSLGHVILAYAFDVFAIQDVYAIQNGLLEYQILFISWLFSNIAELLRLQR